MSAQLVTAAIDSIVIGVLWGVACWQRRALKQAHATLRNARDVMLRQQALLQQMDARSKREGWVIVQLLEGLDTEAAAHARAMMVRAETRDLLQRASQQ